MTRIETSSFITQFIVNLLVIFILYSVILYHWKRRRLYYHASKLPGPFAFPLIGSVPLLAADGPKESYMVLRRISTKYSPLFKFWVGQDLYIVTSRPQDFETLLPRCLEKSNLYKLTNDYFDGSLLLTPVNIWRDRRKAINQSFNINVLNSFVPLIAKHAKNLMLNLEQLCENGKVPSDIFPVIWKYTFDASCETIGDVNPEILHGKEDFLSGLLKYEELLTYRFYNPLYYVPFLWKNSPTGKKAIQISQQARDFVQKLIDGKKQLPIEEETSQNDILKQKRFMNYLLDLQDANKLTHQAILDESPLMLAASSETSSLVVGSLLLVLGMHPDIQEKILEELDSIFGDSNRDITLEDLNQMDYLECTFKETLRIFPPIPFVVRNIDKDITIDSHVFPKGCKVAFLIDNMHRRADLWPDPLKFDPDRFLPENVKTRHRFAYLPFSFGARNCIGLKYAMMSMMITTATILRNYKVVESVDYKKIEDVEHRFYLVIKAKKGYRIKFERRKK